MVLQVKMNKYIAILLLAFAGSATAVDYNCIVNKKLTSEKTYTAQEIAKGQFSIKIEERGNKVFVSRCFYRSIVKKVLCHQYEADKVVFDENTKIKKIHYSRVGEVEIFADLSFSDYFGRGHASYGNCKIVSP